MVPVITFSLSATKIPCKFGPKNTKSIKFPQISNFLLTKAKHYYSFLVKHKKITNNIGPKSDENRKMKKFETICIFSTTIKYVLQQKSGLKSHF